MITGFLALSKLESKLQVSSGFAGDTAKMICVFRLKKRLPPQMMNLIVLDLMLAQQAKMSTLNMRFLKSESPQDFFTIYGLRQSESTACPAAKVSHVDGTLYLFIGQLGSMPLMLLSVFSSSGIKQI